MQQIIVEEMKVKKQIDVDNEIRIRIELLKSALKERNFKTLVLGISGGQDSTLTGKLCRMCIDELNQIESGYKFIAMRLPYGVQFDEDDCQDALKFIQADEVITYNIKPSVESHIKTFLDQGITITDHNKGNIKARERMIAQYLVAGENEGLVVGTDHSAEAITGFFTKFGDAGADVIPLFGLNKRQGKQLCETLGIPSHLYLKVPTADLEDGRPALPDEEALGVTYDQIDDFLEGKEVDQEAHEKIVSHFTRTIHKRDMPRTIYDKIRR